MIFKFEKSNLEIDVCYYKGPYGTNSGITMIITEISTHENKKIKEEINLPCHGFPTKGKSPATFFKCYLDKDKECATAINKVIELIEKIQKANDSQELETLEKMQCEMKTVLMPTLNAHQSNKELQKKLDPFTYIIPGQRMDLNTLEMLKIVAPEASQNQAKK